MFVHNFHLRVSMAAGQPCGIIAVVSGLLDQRGLTGYGGGGGGIPIGGGTYTESLSWSIHRRDPNNPVTAEDAFELELAIREVLPDADIEVGNILAPEPMPAGVITE